MTGWETGLCTACTHMHTLKRTHADTQIDAQMYAHMLASLLDAYAHAADTNTYFPPMLLENPCDSTHAVPAEQTR